MIAPEFLQIRPLRLLRETDKSVLCRFSEGSSFRVHTLTPVRTPTRWTCNTLPGPRKHYP